jgi:uncharacterized membrane protein YfcA
LTEAWWFWPLALFALTFAFGIVAVLAGVGGGVLFVPIVGGFFPFHLDYVRAAGLILALAGALSAGPALLRSGIASLRLAMPLALVGSITSIAGAMLGFFVPVRALQAVLGVIILLIAALMLLAGEGGLEGAHRDDALGKWLQLRGHDWRVHRTAAGIVCFGLIGLVGGLFGLGAGWANVPTLFLIMGAPLKMAVATSSLTISIINASAALIYIERGAVIPAIVAPSILGVMLGARVGVRLLEGARPKLLRQVVIAVLLVSGLRALLKGLGLWN